MPQGVPSLGPPSMRIDSGLFLQSLILVMAGMMGMGLTVGVVPGVVWEVTRYWRRGVVQKGGEREV